MTQMRVMCLASADLEIARDYGLLLPTHNLRQVNYKWSHCLRELHTAHLCHFIEAKGQKQSNDVTVKS